MATTIVEIDSRQLAAILAGLRIIQATGVSGQHEEIATNCGEFDVLGDDDIDTLCEDLNCADVVLLSGGAEPETLRAALMKAAG